MTTHEVGDWYCRQCGHLDGSRVTHAETCDTCHKPVEWHTVSDMKEINLLKSQLSEARELLESCATWMDFREKRAPDIGRLTDKVRSFLSRISPAETEL